MMTGPRLPTAAACFSTSGALPCCDVYAHDGGYRICKARGTTNQPSEHECRRPSAFQLAHGRWCS